jgi:hypothetical protein
VNCNARNSQNSVLIWATCLLGLAVSACAVPAASGDTSAPEPPAAHGEPWTPSEEWTRLNEWDREIRAMDTRGETPEESRELWDAWNAERAEFEQYLIDHPDADAPCDVWFRYAPQELHYRGDECYLASLT